MELKLDKLNPGARRIQMGARKEIWGGQGETREPQFDSRAWWYVGGRNTAHGVCVHTCSCVCVQCQVSSDVCNGALCYITCASRAPNACAQAWEPCVQSHGFRNWPVLCCFCLGFTGRVRDSPQNCPFRVNTVPTLEDRLDDLRDLLRFGSLKPLQEGR